MRPVPSSISDAWTGGEFTGAKRPMARVTLQRLKVNIRQVEDNKIFASAVLGQGDIPMQMPNVKSVEWDRSLGADVANCTITFYNTYPLPLGDHPVASGDFDLPGYYTYNYGVDSWARTRWGTAHNRWQDYLVPDRLLRTYEGYGFDASVCPERDPHLVQTGTWLIDDIEYTADGIITATCRDVGRLLLDQMIFPPVIALAAYPLSFEPYHEETDPVTEVVTGGKTYRPTYLNDSGVPYYGKNALIHGHRPSQAFDTSDSTYWLSVGNATPNSGYSYEFVEGSCAGKNLSSVTFKVFGGPYRVYLSVKIKGKWSGTKKIPYDPKNPISFPNGSNITYSMTATVAKEGTHVFTLTHPVSGVDSVRLTFTGLYNSGIGPYKYRAGVRSITCSETTSKSYHTSTHTIGNYGDYTEIVKYLLACGGWYWPSNPIEHGAFWTYADASKVELDPVAGDEFLGGLGRIWGDLEMSGTNSGTDPVNKLDSTLWDKKPLMDGIAYVRDGLGFIFYIDEGGGAVFRLPNIYTVGNWVGDLAINAGYQVDNLLTIDERQVIVGFRATISSKNLRDWVFVADATGQFGAVSAGYNPIKPNPNLRRVGGWTDQGWKSLAEAQRMADMITMRQAFTYRTDRLTIVANPAIQIDDQVRIYERVSGEGFVHYVKSIKSTNDLESGKWTYDLETNWLGESPLARWSFDITKVSEMTAAFLDALLGGRSGATFGHRFVLAGGDNMTMTGVRH